MPVCDRDGISLAYEVQGSATAPPLVLIAGVCTPRDGWPDGFCRQLVAAGLRVIRFDHRDTGESARLDHLPVPDLDAFASGIMDGSPLSIPYTLSDMAEDVAGLMDALGLDQAHVCGISMGGMIGQILALAYPGRVRSLVCMASTTGETGLPRASPEAHEALMRPLPDDREGFLDGMVAIQRVFAGGSPLFDPVVQRDMAARALDRGGTPAAFARQMAAIASAPGRRRALEGLRIPALVIHGRRDPLFSVAHGRDIADAVTDAGLYVMDDWGHGMAYPALWPEMVQAMADHILALDPGD